MPTVTQRAKAIIDALTNADTPNGKILRAIEANNGLTAEQNAIATNDQKAQAYLSALRQQHVNNVKRYEEIGAVLAAQATVHAAVDTDFGEAP